MLTPSYEFYQAGIVTYRLIRVSFQRLTSLKKGSTNGVLLTAVNLSGGD